MNLSDKLKKKIASLPKLREIEFMGEVCVSPRMTTGEKKAIMEEFAAPETDERRMAEILANLLLDPKTEEPLFDAGFIIDEMPDDMAVDIIRAVFGTSIERAEKN